MSSKIFRVWHKTEKRYLPEEYGSCNYLMADYGSADDLIFEQFTGFTVNGKKIYEGDIVKIKDHLLYEKIIFNKGTFGYHENYKHGIDPAVGHFRRRKDTDPAGLCCLWESFYEIEVIGNVNEHPNLLTANDL